MLRRKPYTEEEKLEVSKKILSLYEEGEYTLESCCEAFGIDKTRLWRWCNAIPELKELHAQIRSKQKQFNKEKLKRLGYTALELLLQPYQVTERTVERVPIQCSTKDGGKEVKFYKKTKTVTKTILPSTSAVIFALHNLDPENFGKSATGGNQQGNSDIPDLEERMRVIREKLAENDLKIAPH